MASHQDSTPRLQYLISEQSNFPGQNPISITMADIQGMKSSTESGSDMIHMAKKPTAFHEHMAAQMNQQLMEGCHP